MRNEGEGSSASWELPSFFPSTMDLKALSALNDKRRDIGAAVAHRRRRRADDYYALWHDPRRTQLTVHTNSRHQVDGFVVVAQTGADLFRPTVTLRAPDEAPRASYCGPRWRPAGRITWPSPSHGRPCSSPSRHRQAAINPHLCPQSGPVQAVVNVLVQSIVSPEGALRFEIQSRARRARRTRR